MSRTEQESLIGESPAFLNCLEQASRIAQIDRPVLVVGERGTGKELIAARIHYLSHRWDGPFVKLNCAAINENLLESELFGHESGAFTGAQKRHVGRFERAHGGTLFLDELATSTSAVQEKLLRVIEYGEFERVGGKEVIQVDVRVIAATNEDLPSLVEQGRFRADLLDRLAFEVITLPPLRHRQEDIPLLANHFAEKLCKDLDLGEFAGFSNRAMKTLCDYHWPGNVRELKNVVERAVFQNLSERKIDSIVLNPFDSPYRPQTENPTAKQEIRFPLSLKTHIEHEEVRLVKAALAAAQYNQKKAAELLSLTYDQLRGYIRKYKILQSDK